MIKKLYDKFKEQINYVIVGALTTAVSLGSYYACVLTFLDPEDAVQLQAANVISWVCAVTFAYFTNRRFVFHSGEEKVALEAVKFFGARVTTLLMDMACMWFFVTLLGMSDKIAKLLVQVIVFVSNYLLSKFLVFRRKR